MLCIFLFATFLLIGGNLRADWSERSASFHYNHTGSGLTPIAIAESPDGWLWIATETGFFRFGGRRYFPLIAPAGIDLSRPKGLAIGPGPTIWLATANGLFRWDEGKITMAIRQSTEAVLVSQRGNVFAISKRSQPSARELSALHVLLKGSKSWIEIPTSEPNPALRQNHRGLILFPHGVRINTIDEDRLIQSVQQGRSPALALSASPGLGDTRSARALWRDAIQDSKGVIWGRAGTDVYSSTDGKISRFDAFTTNPGRFQDTFYEDSQNRIWVMGRRLQIAERSVLSDAPAWCRSFKDVTAMFEDSQGTLWIGQERQGLTAVIDDHVLQRWDQADGVERGVESIARGRDGALFAATPKGLRRLDSTTWKWQAWGGLEERFTSVATTAAGGLLAVPKQPERLGPFSFFEYESSVQPTNRKNVLWNTNLAYFRPRLAVSGPRGAEWLAGVEETFERHSDSPWKEVVIPGGSYVSDIQPESDGSAYLGHENGVSRCRDSSCQPVIRLSDGLLNHRVRSITVKPNQIWIAYRTEGGFSLYTKSGNSWLPRHFLASEGYGPLDTHFLRKDVRGWIWRGTPDGVFVCDGIHLEPENWIQLRFGQDPKDSDANLYGFFEESPQSILIGTASGVVRIFPRQDWFSSVAPQLAGLRANDIPLPEIPMDRFPVGTSLELDFALPGQWPFLTRPITFRLRPLETNWTHSSGGNLKFPRLSFPLRKQLQLEIRGASQPLSIPVSGVYDIWASATAILFPVLGAPSFWWLRRRRAARQLDAERREYAIEKQRFLDSRRAFEPSPADWTGTTLTDRFTIDYLVARGGFATVYRGTDQMNQSPVAIKILHPIQREAQWRQRRFAAEVDALARLDHPGILRLFTHGEASPDQPFLVTEWIEGQTLRAALANGPLEPSRAHKLIADLAESLAAAHSSGILHRDLKPENIMLRICDGIESPVLIDFGIATIVSLEDPAYSTQLAGSLGYVAPERWFGPASPASDVYSLAAIAVELYSGTRYADSSTKPESFHHLFPPNLSELIHRSLCIDPKDRPANAEDFLARWNR